jgi:pimeloyl-ACP methyl ester carboxylesterase
VVVLLHASFASLVMWEPWARELRAHYRVVRLDFTSHGLTGADPSGDYTLQRTVDLLGQFFDARGIDRMAIVGTSSGGTIGIRYAAAHPERVNALVLINPGALEGKRLKPDRDRIPGWASILTVYTPRAAAKYLLTSAFGDPSKVTDAMIDEWWEMWRHDGNRAAILARLGQYKAGDIDAQIAAVKAPVLLVWGAVDPQTPLEQAHELQKMLTQAAKVQLTVLPGIGHMAVQEAPQESLAATRAFLEGEARP